MKFQSSNSIVTLIVARTSHHCVFGKLFVETFWIKVLQVEVKSVCWERKREEQETAKEV